MILSHDAMTNSIEHFYHCFFLSFIERRLIFMPEKIYIEWVSEKEQISIVPIQARKYAHADG